MKQFNCLIFSQSCVAFHSLYIKVIMQFAFCMFSENGEVYKKEKRI